MSTRETGAPNRLAAETSPYLLLHRDNPVDWYPWGSEALARARAEDRPIFLSVGYSTCYWCHVMERESFSDPGVAVRMNRDFINIKVDREERPDLDEIYMTATQILTGQGGWPNSVFLTPELKPFYAGTYFPPDDRHGRPSFASVIGDLASAWRDRRPEVEEQAEEMASAMGRFLEERAAPASDPAPPAVARQALDSLSRRFDREWGGFGGAPKFPTPANLFLLEEFAAEDSEAAQMLAKTLDAMARGGIHDQLAGGFHRYSTDRSWTVPHFEKMLYDNGLLLEAYARASARTGDQQGAREARRLAAFLAREMTAPEGGLWSAIDAETDGHEGAYYVWTPQQLEQVLGKEDAAFLAPLLGVSGPPSFEERAYVLRVPQPLPEVAGQRHSDPHALAGEVDALAAKLLAARQLRKRPATDDKVLTDWNGIAVAGLATAGRLLAAPELLAQAARAAAFLLAELRPAGGPLLHSWRRGTAKIPAYLGDYVHLVRGLLALHEATAAAHWLAAARELTAEQIERLRAPEGGFFGAAAAPDLLFRSKDPFDGALPSPNAVAVLNLLALAARDDDPRWWSEARAALAAFAPLLTAHPDALRMMAVAVRRYHAAGRETPAPQLATAPPPGVLAEEAARVVAAELVVEPGGGDWHPFRLRLDIAAGWHLQTVGESSAAGAPTRLEPADGETELRRLAAHPLRTGDATGALRGSVELRGELRAAGGQARLRLVYQPCDDQRCLAPVARELRVELGTAGRS
jgi:uncharacterized protein YyaL (SSP411 family)